MIRFLRDTWLPTAVFLALSRLVSSTDRSCGPLYCYGPTVVAFVIVPPLWRWFVVRHGRPRIRRAALTGAVVAFLLVNFAMTAAGAVGDARQILSGRPRYAELGALLYEVAMLFVLASVPVAGGIGAAVGSLLALVQRSAWRSAASATLATRRDGALCGGMIACLAAPFTAVLALAILPPSLLPTIPGDRNVSFPLVLVWVWLFTIPAGALLGVGWIERRKRLHASRGVAPSLG